MNDIVVIGGGPAGLAAAHEAVSHGAAVTVLERLQVVGGLARTIAFDGCRFDIGPHRFFTKNDEVRQLFTGLLGDDLVRVARQTRILNAGTYFDYPLTPLNAMLGIGVKSGASVAYRVSYVIGQDGKIAYTYASLDPDKHVENTLTAVKALTKK